MHRLFSQIAITQKAGAEQPDILHDLLDAGMDTNWIIGEDELEIDEFCNRLGQGSFGIVVEGQFCCGPVAVKVLPTELPDGSRITFINEFRILRHIRHPNIALFHGVCCCKASISPLTRGTRCAQMSMSFTIPATIWAQL